MSSSVRFLAATVTAGLLLTPAIARAQTAGFALDQFDPSERGSDWFSGESLDLRGQLRPAVGVVADYANRPLAVYNEDGSLRSAVVANQLFLHVGASLVVADRFRFAFNLPVALYENGQGGTLNGVTYASPGSAGVGDLRLGADARLFGRYGEAFTLAAGFQLFLPTGSQSLYTSDGSVRIQPRVMAAGEIGLFAYSARLGFEYRGLTESYGGVSLGSEVTYGATIGVRPARKILIGPELYGTAGVAEASQILKTPTTPVEGLIGAHYQAATDWRIGVAGGTGFTRGYGSPTGRLVATVEWAPAFDEKPLDSDNDGIPDTEDACPNVAGVRTDDPKTNGCPPPPPPPPDRDKDGILDADDACPDVPGIKTDDPKTNGCPPPPPDRDKDGILDADDACPDVPGVKTEDPKTNGCPPDPDRDKDGIPNEQDACPDEAGPPNQDPKKNGCPVAAVKNNQIVIIDQVKFATGSAQILAASNDILEAVKSVLVSHPEIKKISVEGHTDNVGDPARNLKLSAARAASVVKWLTSHGIDKQRLGSAGFGQGRPLDNNGTPEGRQNNRRVEFHIVDPPPPPQP